MSSTRATPPLLKDLNERTVLEAIRAAAPISRAEISRRMGISKPTVSLALRALAEAGLVREAARGPDGPSYGAVFFEPVPEAEFVLGLDLGSRFLRTGLRIEPNAVGFGPGLAQDPVGLLAGLPSDPGGLLIGRAKQVAHPAGQLLVRIGPGRLGLHGGVGLDPGLLQHRFHGLDLPGQLLQVVANLIGVVAAASGHELAAADVVRRQQDGEIELGRGHGSLLIASIWQDRGENSRAMSHRFNDLARCLGKPLRLRWPGVAPPGATPR